MPRFRHEPLPRFTQITYLVRNPPYFATVPFFHTTTRSAHVGLSGDRVVKYKSSRGLSLDCILMIKSL